MSLPLIQLPTPAAVLVPDETDPTTLVPVDVRTGAVVTGKKMRFADEQVDGDSEHPNNGSGPIVRSPNGKRWRVQVDDSGNLYSQEVI